MLTPHVIEIADALKLTMPAPSADRHCAAIREGYRRAVDSLAYELTDKETDARSFVQRATYYGEN